MLRSYEIWVPGTPAHTRRAKATSIQGKTRIYSPGKNKTEALAIRAACYKTLGLNLQVDGAIFPDEPVGIVMTFWYALPRGKHRKRKPVAEQLKLTRPDVDNCIKAALDALQGIFYEDDKQVIYVQGTKLVAAQGAPAGTTIQVREIEVGHEAT